MKKIVLLIVSFFINFTVFAESADVSKMSKVSIKFKEDYKHVVVKTSRNPSNLIYISQDGIITPDSNTVLDESSDVRLCVMGYYHKISWDISIPSDGFIQTTEWKRDDSFDNLTLIECAAVSRNGGSALVSLTYSDNPRLDKLEYKDGDWYYLSCDGNNLTKETISKFFEKTPFQVIFNTQN